MVFNALKLSILLFSLMQPKLLHPPNEDFMTSSSAVILLPHSRHMLVSLQSSKLLYSSLDFVQFRGGSGTLHLAVAKLRLSFEEDMEISNHRASDLGFARPCGIARRLLSNRCLPFARLWHFN